MSFGSNTGGAAYGGLGGISAYGFNPDGTPSLGPYAMLPNANQTGTAGPSVGPYQRDPSTGGYSLTPSGSPSGSSSVSTSTSAPSQEQAALDYLHGVVSGQNTPYDQTTQDNQFSQASNMNASAESAQNNAIRGAAAAGGASANDPSAQLAQRQTMAQRQGANQRAMGDIQSNANIENYRARTGAANTLLRRADDQKNRQEDRWSSAGSTALAHLYGGGGGGGGNGSTVNNFNLPQQMQQQSNYDWANNQAQREDYLNNARQQYSY